MKTNKNRRTKILCMVVFVAAVCLGLSVSVAFARLPAQYESSALSVAGPHRIEAPLDTDTPTDTATVARSTITPTHTPCAPSCTPTNTRTRTFTRTTTPTPTGTWFTDTPTPTFTPTDTPTQCNPACTATSTRTTTPSHTPCAPSCTPTPTRTHTFTRTPTVTQTGTIYTSTPTDTRTYTPTITPCNPSCTPTPTRTRTPTNTVTSTRTTTPTVTATPTLCGGARCTSTPTFTGTPTDTRTPTITGTPPSKTPTRTHTPCSPACTATPSHTRSPTPTITITGTRPTDTPTFTRTRTPTDTRTITRTPSSTPTPTAPCSVTTFPANDLPINVPDGGVMTSTVRVPYSITIGHIEIANIVISDTDAEEINTTLTSPWGATYLLFSGVCGRTPWTYDTTGFTILESTPNHIGSNCPPNADSYAPIGGIGARQLDAMGVWTLTVRDRVRNGSTISLANWSLRIRSLICATATPPPQYTVTSTRTITPTPTLTYTPTPCEVVYEQPGNDVPKDINDLSTTTSTMMVDAQGTIADAQVIGLTISHTSPSDLRVVLVSPQGTRVNLFDNQCPGDTWTDANTGFNLSDDSLTPIGSVCPPGVDNYYGPIGALSTLDGESITGLWTLEVTDHAAGDVGTLDGWGLRFRTMTLCNTPTSTFTVTPTITQTPTNTSTPTVQATPVYCPAGFQDVPSGDPNFAAIQCATCQATMEAYACGGPGEPCVAPDNFPYFRPNNWYIGSKADAAKLIVLGARWPINLTNGPHFFDVPTCDPYYIYVETAFNHGLFVRYGDGLFHPNNAMPRSDFAKILVVAAGWPINTTGGPHFTDVPTSFNHYTYVETVYNRGVMFGYPDGTFRPNNGLDTMTRAEMAGVITRAFPNCSVATPPPNPVCTVTPVVTPTDTATGTPPTGTPTNTPTNTSTNTPTNIPTNTPTNTPTAVPTSGAVLVSHVDWQGHPAQPDPLQQMPVTITLKTGTTEINYTGLTTDASGFFTVPVGSLANGPYNWRAKGPKYLAKGGTINLTGAAITNLEIGLMMAGDANNDNLVNILDFNIMKIAFGTQIGQPGYDDRTDFTGDQIVNILDFNLSKRSFGLPGAPPVLPGR